MPRKSKVQKEYEFRMKTYEARMNDVFYKVLKNNQMVNPDMIYEEALLAEIPPKEIGVLQARLWKRFKAAKVIVKSERAFLSKRCSRPLFWYLSTLYAPKDKV